MSATITTLLFDLDSTLLPVDTDALVEGYIGELAAYLAPWVNPTELPRRLLQATAAMIGSDDGQTNNLEVFCSHFLPLIGRERAEMEPVFDRFYTERYPRLQRYVQPGRTGLEVSAWAAGQGYELVLATNPVFPAVAARQRMRWAGIDHLPWRLVTAIEDMHWCKPRPEYYREVLARIGRDPAQCLMVGNDADEDLAAAAGGRGRAPAR